MTIEEAQLTITRQEPALLLPEVIKNQSYNTPREQIQTLADKQIQIVPRNNNYSPSDQ
jgi:hypothetical protein